MSPNTSFSATVLMNLHINIIGSLTCYICLPEVFIVFMHSPVTCISLTKLSGIGSSMSTYYIFYLCQR